MHGNDVVLTGLNKERCQLSNAYLREAVVDTKRSSVEEEPVLLCERVWGVKPWAEVSKECLFILDDEDGRESGGWWTLFSELVLALCPLNELTCTFEAARGSNFREFVVDGSGESFENAFLSCILARTFAKKYL